MTDGSQILPLLLTGAGEFLRVTPTSMTVPCTKQLSCLPHDDDFVHIAENALASHTAEIHARRWVAGAGLRLKRASRGIPLSVTEWSPKHPNFGSDTCFVKPLKANVDVALSERMSAEEIGINIIIIIIISNLDDF